MKLKFHGALLAACCLLAGAVPAFAHHSFAAEFQTEKGIHRHRRR